MTVRWPTIRYKDKGSPIGSMSVVVRIAFVIYATIPIYGAAVESYHRAPFRPVASGIGVLLLAVLVASTYVDFRRARQGRSELLRPWFSFFQICIAIAIVAILNLTAGGVVGTYYVLFLLPLLVAAIMGNVTMMAATWLLALGALGVVVHFKSGHHAETLVWTVAVSGAAWAGAALAVHFAVRQFLESIRIAESVSELATTAQRVHSWPGGLEPCLPLLASATAADSLVVHAGPAGAALEPVAHYRRGKPGGRGSSAGPAPEGATAGTVEGGIRRARDTQRVVHIDHSMYIPNRTASGTDIVIVATRDRVPFLAVSTLNSAVTSGQLVAGIAERVVLVDELREEAVTDPLTGLTNRRGMREVLDRMLAHAARSREAFSVAMVDLDEFKTFNDRWGHLAGDDVLRSVGRSLRSGVRAQDVVVRFGGEEFCLLLPGTGEDGARTLVEQLRTTMPRSETLPGGAHPPTFSAGIATWDGQEDRRSLLRRADVALYRAKEAGRNRVESDPPPGDPTADRPGDAGIGGRTAPWLKHASATAAIPPRRRRRPPPPS